VFSTGGLYQKNRHTKGGAGGGVVGGGGGGSTNSVEDRGKREW